MIDTNAAHEYGRRIRNNASEVLNEVMKHPDGTAKPLTPEVVAGVLVAQSNLAIAASIVEAAVILRGQQR